MWCVVYFHDKDKEDFEVFGPFASEILADRWVVGAQKIKKLPGMFHIVPLMGANSLN
jgi:hypothetical protein